MRLGSVCLTSKDIKNVQSQPDPIVSLEYDLIPAKSYDLRSKHADKQFVAIPQLDLSDYSCKTIIDFVHLKIAPKNTSLGPKQINDLIAKAAECKPDVRSLGYNADGSREFKVVVQEFTPSRYFSLRALFKNELELSYPATFLKLEFAIDFYPKTPSVESFAKMHGVLVIGSFKQFKTLNVGLYLSFQ